MGRRDREEVNLHSSWLLSIQTHEEYILHSVTFRNHGSFNSFKDPNREEGAAYVLFQSFSIVLAILCLNVLGNTQYIPCLTLRSTSVLVYAVSIGVSDIYLLQKRAEHGGFLNPYPKLLRNFYRQ